MSPLPQLGVTRSSLPSRVKSPAATENRPVPTAVVGAAAQTERRGGAGPAGGLLGGKAPAGRFRTSQLGSRHAPREGYLFNNSSASRRSNCNVRRRFHERLARSWAAFGSSISCTAFLRY